MNKLIHMNALRALEASARHRSFSAAAKELNVTPAAVGQLVRALENWVGEDLFYRKNSGKFRLVPTKTAELALPEIRDGLEKLLLGLEKLKEKPDSNILTVTVSPAFAAKWLLPRIEKFQNMWPDIDVRLDISTNSLDFALREIDIGVRYGSGDWSGLIAEKFMEEEIYPICSPKLLQKRMPLDLSHETLIHDRSMEYHNGYTSWELWLEKAGFTNVDTSRGMQINNSAAVIQSVINGHGIALARSVMAHDDLAAGRLVRLFPDVQFMSKLSYYIVYRAECASMSKQKAFRHWLFEEVSKSEDLI